MYRYLIKVPVVRELGRRFLPAEMRQKIISRFEGMSSPSAEDFRTLLSHTDVMDPVPGRVAMVCGSLQPGGAERQVANTLVGLSGRPGVESLHLLCKFLQTGTAERHDFYLPLARQSNATIREITRPALKEHSGLPAGVRKTTNRIHARLLFDIISFYQEFRLLRPEVVHSWLDWGNVRAGIAAVLAGVPRILLSGRNLSPRHFALNTDYHHPAYTALAECSPEQVVFANNSNAGARDYEDWLGMPRGRIRVIRNGVRFMEAMRPTSEQDSAFRARLGIPEHAPLIGGMFRFNEEKRPLLWLQTAVHIAQSLPDTHFVLFGQGDMRTQMTKFISGQKMASRFHLSEVLDPSLHGLSPCSLVLLVSRGEGTPNVLLEAQWLGLPVVTVDAGGAAEAVKDNVTGKVVRSDDPADIARAVVDILQDRTFQEKARIEGPRFINDQYGMERMIAETLAAYGPGFHPGQPTDGIRRERADS